MMNKRMLIMILTIALILTSCSGTNTAQSPIRASLPSGISSQADWLPSINGAANTWGNASPSQFDFEQQSGSSNKVSYEVPQDQTIIAGTAAGPSAGPYTWAYTKINPLKAPYDIFNPPANGSLSVRQVMTHEFGHWLYLDDLGASSGCNDAMMYYAINRGNGTQVAPIYLSLFDINGINYQYP